MTDCGMCRLCGDFVGHRTIDHRREDQLRERIHQVIARWWRTASDAAKEMFFQEGGDLVDIGDEWRAQLDAERTARLEAMWRDDGRPRTPPTPP
jgi:hypothetical protein